MSDDFEKMEAAWSKLSGRDKIVLLLATGLLGVGILAYVHREQLIRLWDRFHVWAFVAAGVLITLAIAVDVLRARRWVRHIRTPEGRASAGQKPLTKFAARVVARDTRTPRPAATATEVDNPFRHQRERRSAKALHKRGVRRCAWEPCNRPLRGLRANDRYCCDAHRQADYKGRRLGG